MTRVNTKEVVLSAGESVHIQRENTLVTVVGPKKHRSMDDTDQAVVWSADKGKLVKTPLDRAVQQATVIPSGYYGTLRNPAHDENGVLLCPKIGADNNVPLLELGTSRVLEGPMVALLWPGQELELSQGHRLRMDEYVVLTVMQKPGADVLHYGDEHTSIGDRIIVKGPRFFIPPSGVVMEGGVKKAVRLAPNEYCILVENDGTETLFRGDMNTELIFPRASQEFKMIETDDDEYSVVGKAVDLREYSVQALDGKGKELFIQWGDAGDAERYYFPDDNHEVLDVCPVVELTRTDVRYLVDRDGVAHTVAGPLSLRVNPWVHSLETHPQKGTSPVVSLSENDILYIADKDKVKTVLGRQQVTLGFSERVLQQREVSQQLTTVFHGVSRDNATVSFKVNYLLTLDPEHSAWDADPAQIANQYVRQQLIHAVQSKSIISVMDAGEKGIASILTTDGIAKLDGFTLSKISVEDFKCTDVILKKVYESRHDESLDNIALQESVRQSEVAVRKADVLTTLTNAEKSTEEHNNGFEAYKHELKLRQREREREIVLESADTEIALSLHKERAAKELEQARQETAELVRKRRIDDHEVDLKVKKDLQGLEMDRFNAEASAQKSIMEVITPQISEAIEVQSRSNLTVEAIKHLGAQAANREKTVADILDQYTGGTVLGLTPPKIKTDNGVSVS